MFARIIRAGATAFACVSVIACSDEVGANILGDIEEGTSRDSALMVLGTGPLTATGQDTLRLVNGFRRQMFSGTGKTYEIIYFRDTAGAVGDDIVRELETPLILENGRVIGHGWEFYSELATRERLPAAPPARPEGQ